MFDRSTISRLRLALLATVGTLLLTLAGCSDSGLHPQRDALAAALEESFNQRHDPFVIIEGECDCFVQFMRDGGMLYYDFPNADLAATTTPRASQFHREQGIEEVVIEDIDPNTLQKFELRTWQRAYARAETGAAADAAIKALFRIYDLNRDSRLYLTRGWD